MSKQFHLSGASTTDADQAPPPSMRVVKRDGSTERLHLDKIVQAIRRCCDGLPKTDPYRVAVRTIGGLYDGATTRELDDLSIHTAASLMLEEPEYSKLAARLLAQCVSDEVRGGGVDSIAGLDRLETRQDRRQFLLNLICFAACIEGLFFFGAFAYVYFLRSRGLLHGLAAGTNWVFRDESAHMTFAFEVVQTVRREEPDLFDETLVEEVRTMLREAVACETLFAEDLLGGGVAGLTVDDVRGYLEFCADQRLCTLGMTPLYGTPNPLTFMELQDVQEVTNFFERRVSAYQVAVGGEVSLDEAF